jgi:hypothetical protein
MNHLPQRPDESAWSELEHAFFAAAPPDDPAPAAEPERFDDDTQRTPAMARPWSRYLLQPLSAARSAASGLVAALVGRRLDTAVMAAALAATVLVVAFSTRAPAATLAAPAACSDACLSPRDPTLIASECAGVLDLETDLRSQYCCL